MEFLRSLHMRLSHYTWDLAYGTYHDGMLTKGIDGSDVKIIHNPYRFKWFADPFIYQEDNSYLQLFVEEFDANNRKGRIARLCIDKNTCSIIECSIILEKETHLSFPAIYRIGGQVYVHPENSESGASVIYKYNEKLDKLVDPVIVAHEPLTDAVIVNTGEKYLLFSTKMPIPNGKELFLYMSDCFLGPYEAKTSFTFDCAHARMAGAFFESVTYNTIRPAQNSEGGEYGKSVLFFKDSSLIGQLTPWGKYSGLHTFNVKENTFVIDLKRYDFPFINLLKTYIKRFYE